jgi:predicted RNA-binding Zn-ribbon protein involved in translation (DUF1610 family)
MKKKYICPECRESFTTRKAAKQHTMRQGHKGAIMVEFEEPKTTITKSKILPARGKYSCPECGKKSRSLKGIQDHMKAKKHTGEPVLQGSKIVKTVKQEVVEEPKPEPVPVRNMFCRLRREDAEKIIPHLSEGMEILTNPANNNAILKYTNYLMDDFDWLQFKYEFVEIEMENADVLMCLQMLANMEENMFVYDMAQLKTFGTKGFEEDCVVVSADSNESVPVSAIMSGIAGSEQGKLACVRGIWKKTYTPPARTTTTIPKTTTTTTASKPKPVQKPVQTYKENFDDWDIMSWVAEEEDRGYYYGGGFNSRGSQFTTSRTTTAYTPPPPPSPKAYPVYGITDIFIITDRVIEYDIYE